MDVATFKPLKAKICVGNAGRLLQNLGDDWYTVKEYIEVETMAGSFERFRIRQAITASNARGGHYDHWYAPAARAVIKSTASHICGAKLVKIELVQ